MSDWPVDVFARVRSALNTHFHMDMADTVTLPHNQTKLTVESLVNGMQTRASEQLFTHQRILELADIESSADMQTQYSANHGKDYLFALLQLCGVSTTESIYSEFSMAHEAAPGIALVDINS